MPRETVETMDYAAMMRRMLRAWGRRVVDADPEDLAELLHFQRQLDTEIGTAITRARAERGLSWADVARAAGTSRQAAQQRWGRYGQDHQESA